MFIDLLPEVSSETAGKVEVLHSHRNTNLNQDESAGGSATRHIASNLV
jgi:hypothetical protein